MPATLATALLALQLAAPPSAALAPPPPPVQRAWDDDAGDLARLGRLAARFDLAVIRRDHALLRVVEERVRQEIAGELEEARRERRRGVERRVGQLERARRIFAEARDRVDARSLDRKRSALADVSQAAWAELVKVAAGQERWSAARDERRDRERERSWDREWDREWERGQVDDRRDGWRDDRRDERLTRDEREGWRPPAPPPPAPRAQPLRADRFDALYHAMRQEGFAEGRLRVLDAALAAPDAWLSVDQVERLLGLFAFSQEQLALVRHARPRLVDPERGQALADRFTFEADKEALRRILQP